MKSNDKEMPKLIGSVYGQYKVSVTFGGTIHVYQISICRLCRPNHKYNKYLSEARAPLE